MGLYTVAQILGLTDCFALDYDTKAAALDAAVAAQNLLITRLQQAALTNSDPASFVALYNQIATTQSTSGSAAWYGGQYRQTLRTWDNLIKQFGSTVDASIVNFDTFATWYNNPGNAGGAAYSCLYSWEFALIYYLCSNVMLSPGNVYCPGGPVNAAYEYTTAGGQVVSQATGWQLAHGVVTGGVTSFVLNNMGSVPSANSANQQGYAPVIPEFVVGTTAFVGSATTVLTFTGTNQTGATKTWTVTVVDGTGTGLAAGTVVVPTPATAGDRMRSVTAVAITSGALTAGNWSLRVQQAAGRPS